MKRLISFSLLAITISIITLQPVSAANAADWHAGNIISDSIFYNKNSMSAAEIQNFLNAKVPSCDNWGTQSYAGTTRRAYLESQGETFPLTCLKDYYENPTTKANNLHGQAIPSGAMSAAQIILTAAQDFSINPQVLIVLLQKEQGIVTDDWPTDYQYLHATGYACPDSAPCNTEYYGFYNQVYSAAWQFRHYANNPNSFNHVAGQVNNVRLSPNSACGTMSVYIENQATASLYNYTPYTPNQAALNNLYGTGDGCSSYGNRNFWRYFVDWFGSPYAYYGWQTVAQGVYYDNNKTMPADMSNLVPGQRYYITLTAKNTGNLAWGRDDIYPVRVGTTNPQDRSSPFCDSTWIGCNRPTNMIEQQVGPNQYGNFEFWITAPTTPGVYSEWYQLLAEGVTWMTNSSAYYPAIVRAPSYNGQVVGQNVYRDSSKSEIADPKHLRPYERYFMQVTVKNNSNITWQKSGNYPMRFGVVGDRSSDFCDSSWIACGRITNQTEDQVLPGQNATFGFWFTTPGYGNYTETYMPLAEGAAWIGAAPVTYNFKVEPLSWDVTSIRGYTDSSKSTPVQLDQLEPGRRYYISYHMSNSGWATWQKSGAGAFMLTTLPQNRASELCDSTWTDCTHVAQLAQNQVPTGQPGNFDFWITTPDTRGQHVEAFIPAIEGGSKLGTDPLYLNITISGWPVYTWDIISQQAFTDNTKTKEQDLGWLATNQRYYLRMVVKNTGNATWRKNGSYPIHLGTTSPTDRGSPFCDAATWISCGRPAGLTEDTVAPGQYGTFEFWITTPATPGVYNEIYAPLKEMVAWMDQHTVSFPMIVH